MKRKPSMVWMSAVVTGLLVASAIAVHGRTASQVSQSESGSALFKTYCASCHGQSGRGNGAVAIFLRVRPADLTQIAKRNKGTFPKDQIYRIIDGRQTVKTHGESQMPVWGDAFSKSTTVSREEDVVKKIRALVDYLESIQERPAD
jgi:mono/diheme cytochrome c family protein